MRYLAFAVFVMVATAAYAETAPELTPEETPICMHTVATDVAAKKHVSWTRWVMCVNEYQNVVYAKHSYPWMDLAYGEEAADLKAAMLLDRRKINRDEYQGRLSTARLTFKAAESQRIQAQQAAAVTATANNANWAEERAAEYRAAQAAADAQRSIDLSNSLAAMRALSQIGQPYRLGPTTQTINCAQQGVFTNCTTH